ncbi:alpha/beta fold hydrolase [Nocardia sp. NPDC020380]|uniref:alpha/beta fold hydrolase n=1 Tax=Nocardia sp. NPDC020380 TaxID=3364309 RepID=UPI0037947ABC
MTKNIRVEARSVPPVGGFQQVGGRRIFVSRLGGGGPAVVLLPGAGAVGLDYFLVQQGVSRFASAVVYDRGGSGFSDPVPLPRTAAAVAEELHGLLHSQSIVGPYVLVAHSLGGAYMHRFAQLYPREVAGVVCVDAFHRDWDRFVPAVASLAATERMGPDPVQMLRMRAALREMYGELLRDYPLDLREVLIDAHVSAEWLRTGVAERGSLVALAEQILRHGGVLISYPEGRLVAPGETEPYKPGVAKLALATGIPIIPVGTTGTDRVLPMRRLRGAGPAFDRRQQVIVHFGEPIDPREFDDPEKLLDHLRLRIENLRR